MKIILPAVEDDHFVDQFGCSIETLPTIYRLGLVPKEETPHINSLSEGEDQQIYTRLG